MSMTGQQQQRTLLFQGISLATALVDTPLVLPRLYTGQRTQLVSAIAISKGISAGGASFGLFTGAGGTGTTLVASVALSTLVALNAFQVLTLAAGATGTLITNSPIFARVITAGAGGIGMIDLELIISDVG